MCPYAQAPAKKKATPKKRGKKAAVSESESEESEGEPSEPEEDSEGEESEEEKPAKKKVRVCGYVGVCVRVYVLLCAYQLTARQRVAHFSRECRAAGETAG